MEEENEAQTHSVMLGHHRAGLCGYKPVFPWRYSLYVTPLPWSSPSLLLWGDLVRGIGLRDILHS